MVVLARLIPEKGVLQLVEELARCTSWSRAVIGGDAQDPTYARRVRERIGALGLEGRVTLAGKVDLEDVPGFLASIDVLAVLSPAEAEPTVILEALPRTAFPGSPGGLVGRLRRPARGPVRLSGGARRPPGVAARGARAGCGAARAFRA